MPRHPPTTQYLSMDTLEKTSSRGVAKDDSLCTDELTRPWHKTTTMKNTAVMSAYMAIAASAFGLISDGYHNNLMTMTNVG